ncbi:MAG: penicillin-binding protein activator LpoB [bacterium]
MKKSTLSIVLLLFSVLLLQGCASSQPRVSRIDPGETVDLTGEWNDSDSSRVAQKMVSDCLNRPWLSQFRDREGHRPTVIVGLFRNKSSEHIPTETFTKDMERELLNSGKVDFVAMAEEREALRKERRDQARHASEQTAARLAQETGADYMLQGVFHAQKQQWKGEQVVNYKVDMELIDIESNQKAWMGSKEIKKRISQSSYSW